MEKMIKAIVEKVREMYKYDKKFGWLVSQPFKVSMFEKDGTIKLEKISFEHYDKLEITDKGISFYPEMKNKDVLIEYKDFTELLRM